MGAKLRRAVGMAGKEQAGTQPAEQQLQADTAGRLFVRLRPQNKRPQMTSLAAKTQLPTMMASCRAVQVGGGSAVVLALRKAGADLPKPVPTPPIAFACHCPYPLP